MAELLLNDSHSFVAGAVNTFVCGDSYHQGGNYHEEKVGMHDGCRNLKVPICL